MIIFFIVLASDGAFQWEKPIFLTGKRKIAGNKKHPGLLGSFVTRVRAETEVLLGVFVPMVDDLIYCCAISLLKSVKMLLLLPLTEEQKAASLVEDGSGSPGSPDNGAKQQRLTL